MQNNLRKKPTFNELINYLEIKQPKIKYPDRWATFLHSSHYSNNIIIKSASNEVKTKSSNDYLILKNSHVFFINLCFSGL